jgi:hypothetical protein
MPGTRASAAAAAGQANGQQPTTPTPEAGGNITSPGGNGNQTGNGPETSNARESTVLLLQTIDQVTSITSLLTSAQINKMRWITTKNPKINHDQLLSQEVQLQITGRLQSIEDLEHEAHLWQGWPYPKLWDNLSRVVTSSHE